MNFCYGWWTILYWKTDVLSSSMCMYTHFKHFLWCISPFAKVGVVSICENMKDISSLVKLQWIKNPDEHQERDYYDLPFAEKVTWKTNLEPNVWPILQKQVIFFPTDSLSQFFVVIACHEKEKRLFLNVGLRIHYHH